MKKALIIGVSGQDGTYLAKFLLNKGYSVFGSSRSPSAAKFKSLASMEVLDKVNTLSIQPEYPDSIALAIKKIQPNEIYFLSGQSSVGQSFDTPIETFTSIASSTVNLLECVRKDLRNARVFNACSSECFGETKSPATEQTTFSPRSPYGVAKTASHLAVKNYREAYGLFCCSGFLFPHESPIRPSKFVTQKIISTAVKIANGRCNKKLHLGDISVSRDWGYAGDYVEAMWLMLQLPTAEDFVLATGHSISLKEFLNITFKQVGLDWTDHVVTDANFGRPSEIRNSSASPQKAATILGWSARTDVESLIAKMVRSAQISHR